MFCRQCGTENADTAKFCKNCGASLTATAEQAEPKQATEETTQSITRQVAQTGTVLDLPKEAAAEAVSETEENNAKEAKTAPAAAAAGAFAKGFLGKVKGAAEKLPIKKTSKTSDTPDGEEAASAENTGEAEAAPANEKKQKTPKEKKQKEPKPKKEKGPKEKKPKVKKQKTPKVRKQKIGKDGLPKERKQIRLPKFSLKKLLKRLRLILIIVVILAAIGSGVLIFLSGGVTPAIEKAQGYAEKAQTVAEEVKGKAEEVKGAVIKEPKLENATLATEVDPETAEAVTKATTFPVGSTVLYATVHVTDVGDTVMVSAVWNYVTNNMVFSETDIEIEKDEQIMFHVDVPGGIPRGDYSVDIKIDGEIMQTLSFTVT